MFKWPREETKPIADDANRFVAKSSERGEPPCGEAQANACNNRHYVNSSGHVVHSPSYGREPEAGRRIAPHTHARCTP